MMSPRLVLLSALLLCVGVFGLEEETRVCDLEETRVICVDSHSISGNGNEIKLTCGDNGQVISKVLVASFGTPEGSCPSASGIVNEVSFDENALNFTADGTCSAVNSAKVIQDACKDKEECTIKIGSEFSLSSPGLAGCVPALDDLNYTLMVQCEDGTDLLSIMVAMVIALIGIGLGATLTPEALKETWTLHKKGIIVGWLSQFGFMPLISFIWIKIMGFEDLVALGVILVGSAPGGVTSNLFTYYAKGNVALSIIMSFASTMCSLFMLPLLVYVYVDKGIGVAESIQIPFAEIFQTLLIAILPVLAGVAIRLKSDKIAGYVEKAGSLFGALFILAALVTGILDNPDLFSPSDYPKTWIAAIFFQPLGALFGFVVARLVGLTGPEVRAVTLETGIQNYTIAITIIVFSYEGCERVVALTFVLVSTFFYLFNSIWLVVLFRYVHAKYDDPVDVLAIDGKEEK